MSNDKRYTGTYDPRKITVNIGSGLPSVPMVADHGDHRHVVESLHPLRLGPALPGDRLRFATHPKPQRWPLAIGPVKLPLRLPD